MTVGAAPTATYRLQLTPAFGFDDAAAVVPYLADLGVSHLYLSPILEAVRGSMHGYDVVDHARLRTDFGGEPAFDRLVERVRAHSLGLVADIVPNHMAIPVPEYRNRQLWSVLRDGRESPYAPWFDIDWAAQDGQVVLPLLGADLDTCVERGEVRVDPAGGHLAGGPVVRYYEHVFPVRPGTEALPIVPLLARQHYRLADWRSGAQELNYRRFFDVSTLIAVRVEDPAVFDATHGLVLRLVHEGKLDGLRIDHPDGLADPRGYLRRLGAATGGRWTVVEKILEGTEQLPADWTCAGTTGYDALARIGGVFLATPDVEAVRTTFVAYTGATDVFEPVAAAAKRVIVEDVLPAEVARLAASLSRAADPVATPALATASVADRTACLTELLVAIDRYRAYVVPGEPTGAGAITTMGRAAAGASARLPSSLHAALAETVDLLLGRTRVADTAAAADAMVRFQQTCGPVMAKGLEDTAGYRWFPLASLAEVGDDPGSLGVSVEAFHAYAAQIARDWPATMTTISTHDTKRSEDVRARLAALARHPNLWARAVAELDTRCAPAAHGVDAATAYLLWQTAIGAWPITADRLGDYAVKAVREAKLHTTWTAPDEAYETAVREFARGLVTDPVAKLIGDVVAAIAADERAIVLGQKLVHLTMPGVPDVYQGCEAPSYTLVDPDNRRAVDFATHAALLAGPVRPGALAWEKLTLTRAVLRLRRAHPDWFGPGASYEPLPSATGRTLAFSRGGRVVVAVPVRGTALDPADAALPPGTSLLPELATSPAGQPLALLLR